MLRHFWHNWLYILALFCAASLLGGLTLLGGIAHAQTPSGTSSASLSPAQQALKADLGPNSPLVRRERERQSGKLPASIGAPKQAPECTGWSLVPSANPSSYAQLMGTVALSPKDIWAAGLYADDNTGTAQTLIEHWDGRAWSVVSSPNLGSYDNYLTSIAAVSPKDMWAVGYYWNGTHFQTLTEHWNGSAWSVVSSPNPGTANNYLNGVTAIAPNNVWAVGTDHIDVNGPALVTLIEHWNGSTWSVVSSPNPAPGSARNEFTGVAGTGPNDIWAVGWSCTSNTDCFNGVITPRTMTEHFDGSTWSIVASPNVGPRANQLEAVSMTSANDVWTVGVACTAPGCSLSEALAEHWDGRAWSIVPSPAPDGSSPVYWGVLAITPNDAWAVGSNTVDGGNTYVNFVSHWDGTRWSQVDVTSPGGFDNDLRSLANIGRNNVWVVGDLDNGNGEQTQVQHFDGPCQ